MKKSRFTDEQIVGFLRQAEAGMAVKELCRQNGFSDATFYKWRARFGGLQHPLAAAGHRPPGPGGASYCPVGCDRVCRVLDAGHAGMARAAGVGQHTSAWLNAQTLGGAACGGQMNSAGPTTHGVVPGAPN
jgi:putative transposase